MSEGSHREGQQVRVVYDLSFEANHTRQSSDFRRIDYDAVTVPLAPQPVSFSACGLNAAQRR